jgi:GNAT superfamily N-acetyltransferase
MKIESIQIDYNNPSQAADLIQLLNAYAEDPMGTGKPLPDHVKQNLCKELAEFPTAYSVITYVDGKPAALANCIICFSTFSCGKIVNFHDIIVDNEYRGLGLSQHLMQKAEAIAKDLGAVKMTLEVLEGNPIAQNAYRKMGFDNYQLDPNMGNALFMDKKL